ncbi:hypothetical protein SDC9_126448 [bioreactor metagenome]|uniref:Uncharacterized protein n=1 Tax=bioreactor metagenome TaxID=1076179 RepID=A0A645CR88_9ZZZZ
MEIGISCVHLKHREFRVVGRVDSFVTEYATDFINLFHAADHKAFQVQLQRDAHVQFHVQCIVVRDERSCGSSACHVMQCRCFDFQIAQSVQVGSDFADDLAALHELIETFFVADQVKIALTVFLFNVRQAMIFVRQRTQCFRQMHKLRRFDGDFTGIGFHDRACYANDVSEIGLLKDCIILFPNSVFAHVNLDLAFAVLQMSKANLPFSALCHDSAGY